jgi:hypothetical protein
LGASLVILGFLGLGGCGLVFAEPDDGLQPSTGLGEMAPLGTAPQEALAGPELPGGFGTLRQEDLAIRVRRGDLEMYLIPLSESVTRTGAPDTWARLSALEQTHRTWFRNRTGADTPYVLFLAVLYAEGQPMAFEPEELAVVSGGLRHRLEGVRALTPGWDQGRVIPGDPQMAVYAFPPGIDLDREDLEVEYHEVRGRDWSRILPRVRAERARILGGIPQSSPYF